MSHGITKTPKKAGSGRAGEGTIPRGETKAEAAKRILERYTNAEATGEAGADSQAAGDSSRSNAGHEQSWLGGNGGGGSGGSNRNLEVPAMSETKPNPYGSPVALGVILLLAVATYKADAIIEAIRKPAPSPVVPTPGPQPLVDIEARVKQAIGDNPDMALRYAALYAQAMGVVGDTSRSARQIQEEIGRANKLLGLDGGDEFREVVRAELKPYGGTNPDRTKWAESLQRLSKACKGAAK